MATSRNPALCDQCNESLLLDDSVIEPYLTTSDQKGLYIGQLHSPDFDEFAMPISIYGGIDYARQDDLPDLPALSHAAKNGCEFCAAVKEGLETKFNGASWWRTDSGPLILRIQYSWYASSDRIDLNGVVVSVSHNGLKGWNERDLKFLICATEGEDSCNKWFNLQPGLQEDQPWSPNNIFMASRWIFECVDQLDHCKEKPPLLHVVSRDIDASTGKNDASRQFLPSRLLDLFPGLPSQPGNTTPDEITLFDTASLRQRAAKDGLPSSVLKYAALSYCWGDVDSSARTTGANLKDGCRHISIPSLPQCLQDAVTVARSLDIRYLWIDALCIIQGDADDWAREAGKMFEIFQNAFLTIGAAASTSTDEGFLTRRSPRAVSLPFSSSCNPQVSGNFSISTVPSFPFLTDGETNEKPLENDLFPSKWDRRGWVWQEQKLSKRLLIFGREMLHFKCDHCTRSEDDNIWSDGPPPFTMKRGWWEWWMEGYSQKQLTYLRDKLPAVSGLARLMDRNSVLSGEGPAEYLAGLWFSPQETRLEHSWRVKLYWKLSHQDCSFQEMLKGLTSGDLEVYSAPSWSWASRREGADWQGIGAFEGHSPQAFEAQVEDHNMVLMGPDRLGRVKPGSYLKLSGLMHRTPLYVNAAKPSKDHFMEWKIPDSHLRFSLDWKYSVHRDGGDLDREVQLFGLWRTKEQLKDIFRGLLLLQDGSDSHFYRVGVFFILRPLSGLECVRDQLDGDIRGQDEVDFDYVDWERTSVQIM
ncbi:hypothetical protein Daus18300_007944 [Diaporthe australafricana]|uniref:Heterokaryon incompatibility domain-containing protein n=1 Tax=Diaporthe australafricana TaxID=127596 RepID=A0ABR3WK00_9PEZI